MATTEIEFTAAPRELGRKSDVNELRRTGQIPGVVYGKGEPATAVQLNEHDFMMMLKRHPSDNLMMQLQVGESTPRRVLLKQVQYHPLTSRILHVDFHEVSPDRKVKVKLPLHLVGTPVGVTQSGGTLDVHLRSLNVECKSGDMLESFDVDISHLNVGEHLHVKSIQLPAGYRMITAGNVSIASILKARVSVKKGEEEAADSKKK